MLVAIGDKEVTKSVVKFCEKAGGSTAGGVEARKKKVGGALPPYPVVAMGSIAPPTRRSVAAAGVNARKKDGPSRKKL